MSCVRRRRSRWVRYEAVSRVGTTFLAGLGALLLWGPVAPASADYCEGEDTAITADSAITAEPVELCLVNVHRSANGLDPLTMDPALRIAARTHSRWMDDNDRLCHTPTIPDPGPCDGTPDSRAAAAGYPFPTGENIAWTSFPMYTPRDMFELWHNSPGHNMNMLYPDYETVGVGFIVGHHGLVGTQHFGLRNNGATDTAVDLLRRDACPGAQAATARAEAAVAKAKRKLHKANGRRARKRAKRKLKAAKAALASAQGAEEARCHLGTYADSSLSPP